MARLAIVVVLALLLGGCGKAVPPGAPPENGTGVVVAPAMPRDSIGLGGAPACRKDAIPGLDPAAVPAERAPIPEGFATAWVVRCRDEIRDVPGKGKWTVSVVERADTPATELVAELRKPSDPRSDGACTMELRVPPYFLLVDSAGRVILPAVPDDSCGQPRVEATKPLERLDFRVVSETPRTQVQSQRSVDSDCPDMYKDMIAITEDTARPAPATAAWTTAVEALRLCVYRAEADLVGRLATTSVIGPAPARHVVELLGKAGPAAPCASPHTRFATLAPAGTTSSVMVELDGCHRLLRQDGTLGQLDAATVTAITG
jgi:hypothetical protein